MTSSPKKSKRSESKSDNQFHHKLFSILENAEYQDVISWDEVGLRFEIKSREKMIEKVLPLFFSQKKLPSFIRQLNYYGFKCCRDPTGPRLYFHPFFQKGNRSLLSKMMRHKPMRGSKSLTIESPQPAEKPCHLKYEIDELMRELQITNQILAQLQEENQALQCEVEKFESFKLKYVPDMDFQASKRHFGEGVSTLISRMDQVPHLQYTDSFQSNERTFHSSSENVQSDQIEHRSSLQEECPNLNYDSYDFYLNPLEISSFLPLKLRNFF